MASNGMRLKLCGSFRFAREMLALRDSISRHEVVIDQDLEYVAMHPEIKSSFDEQLALALKGDSLRKGFAQIAASDGILVANYDKGAIKGYVGPSVLMETAVAFHTGKKIFLLSDLDRKMLKLKGGFFAEESEFYENEKLLWFEWKQLM